MKIKHLELTAAHHGKRDTKKNGGDAVQEEIEQLRTEGYPLVVICSALGIIRSTVYKRARGDDAAANTSQVDEEIATKIRSLLDSEETFGYRRVWAYLDNLPVNVKKVHRITKLRG